MRPRALHARQTFSRHGTPPILPGATTAVRLLTPSDTGSTTIEALGNNFFYHNDNEMTVHTLLLFPHPTFFSRMLCRWCCPCELSCQICAVGGLFERKLGKLACSRGNCERVCGVVRLEENVHSSVVDLDLNCTVLSKQWPKNGRKYKVIKILLILKPLCHIVVMFCPNPYHAFA